MLGDGSAPEEANPTSAREGDTVILHDAVPSNSGYLFAGWYTDPSFSTASKVTSGFTYPGGDLTLYAKYAPKKYNIVFHANGGSGNMISPEVDYDRDSTNYPLALIAACAAASLAIGTRNGEQDT